MGSRTEGLQRLLVIINKLKGKKRNIPARELKRYIAEAMEMRGYSGKSGRTLERDIEDIQSLFGISIAYAKREQGYYIKEEDESIPERYGQLLQNFDLLNALEGDTNLRTYVLAEHHRPLPSECLPMLISAIKHRHPVTFRYILLRQDDKVEEKKVLPHYLKESNQRWYLLAYDEGVLKTFGVDRIRDLRICASETFKRNMDIRRRTEVRCLGRQIPEVGTFASFPAGLDRQCGRVPHQSTPAYHQRFCDGAAFPKPLVGSHQPAPP